MCIVFEGWDAAGKGGAIKRLVEPLDPRHVHVAPFAAPTHDELRHHFLWRFWPPLPGWGGMTIFDRSWYGRVLVERVENLATEVQWRRAYQEINDFEHTLAEEGMVVIKLWMHMSHEEQLRRFERRRDDPLKSWKLTDEDWRNREKRPQYHEAVNDMLRLTNGPLAPWDVISSESKRYGRVEVIETVIRRMEAGHGALGCLRAGQDEEQQKTELALAFDDAEFTTGPTADGDPRPSAANRAAEQAERMEAPAMSRLRHHDPLRRDPAARSTRSGSPACATSATPTCGRPRSTAPTGSPRSPWPPPGSPTLKLGVAITPAYTRGPALLAQSVASMADAAPGQFAFGLGASSEVIVANWNGLAFENQYRRVRDTLRFLQAAFTGEKITEDYDTFSVKGFRLARIPEQLPPIYLAALRPGMLHLAGQGGRRRHPELAQRRRRGHFGGRGREGPAEAGRPDARSWPASSSSRPRTPTWPARSGAG